MHDEKVALRDQFAMTALQGLCAKARSIDRIGGHTERTAGEAYDYADAMMAERATRTPVVNPAPVAPGVMEALEDVLGYLATVRQIPEVRQALECVYWPADHPVFKAHTVLAEAKTKPVGDSDGWIEWGGGDCPSEKSERLDLKLRNGHISRDVRAGCVDDWSQKNLMTDIIAYRVVKP